MGDLPQSRGQAHIDAVSPRPEPLPRIISWNTTFRCNLRCAHCYVDGGKAGRGELSTEEGKRLIDQIAEVSWPILVLSGGEPLMRGDIFELAQYGTEKGLRMVMGSNGTLIDDGVAGKLRRVGVRAVAISLDSTHPHRHDAFRGVEGAWRRSVEGAKACRRAGLELQINTTLTRENFDEVEDIMGLAEELGAKAFHLFFLVPTGRGQLIKDVTPADYERMLGGLVEKMKGSRMEIRPTCAPQFMRIAHQRGVRVEGRSRGCIAGLSYCRIYPTGEVTPCPYLPVGVGSVREQSFGAIWFGAKVLHDLRDLSRLEGRCGLCEYKGVCGGCRARAYGLTVEGMDVCGGLHPPSALRGNYLAEEPWCPYQPTQR